MSILTLKIRKKLTITLSLLGAMAVVSFYVLCCTQYTSAAIVETTYTSNHSVLLSSSAVPPPPGAPTQDNSRFSASSYGQEFSCMITADWKIFCAGENDDYTLGDGTTNQRNNPVQFGTALLPGFNSKKFVQVSSGGNSVFGGHTCGLTADKEIYCAGRNDKGELGIGSTANQPSPVLFGIGGGGGAGKLYTQVAAGSAHTCGLTTTQEIYCAGLNDNGQLGAGLPGGQYASLHPFGAGLGKSFTKVAAGITSTCAVTTLGEVYCSGLNDFGQLGNGGAPMSTNSPVRFGAATGKTFTSVSTGTQATCALTSDQLIYCSGKNLDGELGDNSFTQRSSPVQFASSPLSVAFGKKFTQVSTGGTNLGSDSATSSHTCAVSTEKLIYCSGENGQYQLGYSVQSAQKNPVLFGGVTPPTIGRSYNQVSAGNEFTCALGTDQLVYCVGDNSKGGHGIGSENDQDFPGISMILL